MESDACSRFVLAPVSTATINSKSTWTSPKPFSINLRNSSEGSCLRCPTPIPPFLCLETGVHQCPEYTDLNPNQSRWPKLYHLLVHELPRKEKLTALGGLRLCVCVCTRACVCRMRACAVCCACVCCVLRMRVLCVVHACAVCCVCVVHVCVCVCVCVCGCVCCVLCMRVRCVCIVCACACAVCCACTVHARLLCAVHA